jgi:hypothetical protein
MIEATFIASGKTMLGIELYTLFSKQNNVWRWKF